ncbi:MAG TPA: hypothetical protein V6C65_00770 [Allocoleopsis sp.]
MINSRQLTITSIAPSRRTLSFLLSLATETHGKNLVAPVSAVPPVEPQPYLNKYGKPD